MRGSVLARAASLAVLAALPACASSNSPDVADYADGSARITPAGWHDAKGTYLAERPEAFEDRVVGDGHCVAYVKAAAGVPHTAAWRPGPPVHGNPHIRPGTPIATFEADGTYTNESGNHAAIYLDQDDHGIWVYDQWLGQPVHKRLIRFAGGKGSDQGRKSNDGTRFAVIR